MRRVELCNSSPPGDSGRCAAVAESRRTGSVFAEARTTRVLALKHQHSATCPMLIVQERVFSSNRSSPLKDILRKSNGGVVLQHDARAKPPRGGDAKLPVSRLLRARVSGAAGERARTQTRRDSSTAAHRPTMPRHRVVRPSSRVVQRYIRGGNHVSPRYCRSHAEAWSFHRRIRCNGARCIFECPCTRPTDALGLSSDQCPGGRSLQLHTRHLRLG